MSSIEKEDLAKLLTSLLVSNPLESSTIPELDNDYQQYVGKTIPYYKFGFPSLEKFLLSIPNKLKIQVINGVKVVKPVISSKVSHIRKLIDNQKKPSYKKKFKTTTRTTSANTIPRSIQERLKYLIDSFQGDGLLCAELPRIYQLRYKKELNYHTFKYTSLIDMCRALPRILICRKGSTGEDMLFSTNPNTIQTKPHYTMMDSSSTQQAAERETPRDQVEKQVNYPFNVLKFGEAILSQFLFLDVKVRDTIKVTVSEIYDPSKFWVTLDRYSSDFYKLQQNMQLWYSRCTTFRIDEKFLKYGIYCCIRDYKDEFYRVVVVKLMLENHFVKVFLIDYGTVTSIDSRNLFFLHKNFSFMPQQAIKARLGGIHPRVAQRPWSPKAFNQFTSFVSDKLLRAKILKIDNKEEVIEIVLKDYVHHLSINDKLVHKRHALFSSEVQDKGKFSNIFPVVDDIHLYPTFNEIEQGFVPSIKEANKLFELGFSRDYLYPHYYKTKKDIIYNTVDRAAGITKNEFVDDRPPDEC